MTKFTKELRVVLPTFVMLLLLMAPQSHAQGSIDHVAIRLANAHIDMEGRSYLIDVEMSAVQPGQKLFGINLRFFYDASNLDFTGISDLHPSYGIMGAVPFAYKGNGQSGRDMFNFSAAASYLNTAIQLMNETAPLMLSATDWTKVATLNFSIPESVQIGSQWCPSLIWDQKQQATKAGFLPGSSGLVVTLMEEVASTRETTKPAVIFSESFNWAAYNEATEMPFGAPLSIHCATVTAASSVSPGAGAGFQIYQNYPNPFAEDTVIEFDLPGARKSSLIFSDANGKLLHTVTGDYAAGRNSVRIPRKILSVHNAVVFYRLECEDFTSKALKMILVGL